MICIAVRVLWKTDTREYQECGSSRVVMVLSILDATSLPSGDDIRVGYRSLVTCSTKALSDSSTMGSTKHRPTFSFLLALQSLENSFRMRKSLSACSLAFLGSARSTLSGAPPRPVPALLPTNFSMRYTPAVLKSFSTGLDRSVSCTLWNALSLR